jgi:hypothetical protein
MKRNVLFVFAFMMVLFTPLWAQTEADFEVGLTKDGIGVVIKQYTGKVMAVKIPATIQGMPVKEIGGEENYMSMAPFSRSAITSVVIPDGITTIGKDSFRNCRQLTSVTLPNTITSIGESAFSDCVALTSITIPNSVTFIGRSAFSSSGVTAITWPAGVHTISSSVFWQCSKLAAVVIPEGVTTIEGQAFTLTALTNIVLPSTIELIGPGAFSSCSSLTTVSVSESVTVIKYGSSIMEEHSAFSGCKQLSLASQANLKRLGYKGSF